MCNMFRTYRYSKEKNLFLYHTFEHNNKKYIDNRNQYCMI